MAHFFVLVAGLPAPLPAAPPAWLEALQQRGNALRLEWSADVAKLVPRDHDSYSTEVAAGGCTNASFSSWAKSLTHPPIDIPIELFKFVLQEPRTPLDAVTPPQLPNASQALCKRKSLATGLTGRLRSRPARMVDVVLFAFDADALEVRLHELSDVVDAFILVEATVTFRGQRKPIVWDLVRHQARFKHFRKRVVSIVFDEADLRRKAPEAHKFGLEFRHRELLGQVLPTILPADAVVSFGDADELALRSTVHAVKHCETAGHNVDVASWFPMGRFDQAFKSDYPVAGLPYTFAAPAFRRPDLLEASGEFCRGRCVHKHYLPGGVHLTQYAYAPYLLLKCLTTSDTSVDDWLLRHLREGTFDDLTHAYTRSHWQERKVSLEQLFKDYPSHPRHLFKEPWLLQQNPRRYPVWQGQPDPRYEGVGCVRRM